MDQIKDLSLEDREALMFEEIKNGNMPSFCKTFKTITGEKNGVSYQFQAALDYLSIGSDSNFCRVPISPMLAQRIADHFGYSLPTTKMVDEISQAADQRINPITYAPNGNDNEQVWQFVKHQQAIENVLANSNETWDRNKSLVDGLKKDVVISNRLIDRPGKVAIYGWYKLDGTFWQPLYTGHIDTYVDYSHGVRLVHNSVIVNEDTLQLTDVLKDPALYSLFSDESGIMAQPYYAYNKTVVPPPSAPRSFGLKVLNGQEVELSVQPDSDTLSHIIEVTHPSNNDVSTFILEKGESSKVITGLVMNQSIHVRLQAKNEHGVSPFSETLSITPSDLSSDLLIVQGFDRATEGNSLDYMKYHAASAVSSAIGYDAATNDAIEDRLFSINDYKYVDYVLGEESTADETFSHKEQDLIQAYLQQGGNLLVSGSEIGWDLDHKGDSKDQSFYHDYLKAAYQYDAPFNQAATWYTAKGLEGSFFQAIESLQFDDGTQGTFDVKYADQITPLKGSEAILEYTGGSSTAYAAVAYTGIFPSGTDTAKVINIGFPLESIYPDSSRDQLFRTIINYFNHTPTPDPPVIAGIESLEKQDTLFSISSNPVDEQLSIQLHLPIQQVVAIVLYPVNGTVSHQLYDKTSSLKGSQLDFSVANYPVGLYCCMLRTDEGVQVKKVLIRK
ncbi:hypothetical protein GCM10023331_07250 [Algivirga pacifica]|uniref:Fibronectin type-III domain-containing protein n=2 Tax=Algivirga pacifica TaxID=1162670 RepID=A0ABP9D1L9_9BACT